MSFFSRNKAPDTKASNITLNQLIEAVAQQYNTGSGISVSPENAMKCSTVYAVVRVLSSAFCQLPVHVYRRSGEEREILHSHRLAPLLSQQPNEWQSKSEFWRLVMVNLLLWGNFYAYKRQDGSGRVRHLQPLHPGSVRPEQDPVTLKISYHVSFTDKTERVIPQEKMLHIRGISVDGIVGISPVVQAKETIALALAAEKMAGQIFANGAVPYIVLKHPGTFKDQSAFDRFRESWRNAFSLSAGKSRGTAVLEGGMEIETVQMNAVEAQFLETRRFQKEEICSVFGVPPHKISMLERATFSNIEQQSLEFVVDSLMPYLVIIEDALKRDLLGLGDEFVKFNVDGLLRGDIKSRSEALQIQRQNGVISANEWRALEDMNPIEGGDEYMTPLNMTNGPQAEDDEAEDDKDEIL